MRLRWAALAVAVTVLAGCGEDRRSAADAPRVPLGPTWVSGTPEPRADGTHGTPGGRTASATDEPTASSPSQRRSGRADGPRDPTGPDGPGGLAGLGDLAGLDDAAGLAELAELAERQAAAERRRAAARGLVLGADISWPQCPRGLGIPERRTLGAPLPLPAARYVVVGLTNGPAFVENPCLADQVSLVRESGRMLAAYAVTSFPDAATLARVGGRGPYDASTRDGTLANAGYQQARFGVASMRRVGLDTPVVWVDVEPVPDFEWSSDRAANAAVVRGVVRGYREAGYRVGVYSTAYLWQQIVGDLRLGLPEWRAAGQTSRAEALRRCGPEAAIQGGPAVMGQWVEDGRDQNLTCPGVSADLGLWFSGP